MAPTRASYFEASVEAPVEAPVWRLHGASIFIDAIESYTFSSLRGDARGGARVAPPRASIFNDAIESYEF